MADDTATTSPVAATTAHDPTAAAEAKTEVADAPVDGVKGQSSVGTNGDGIGDEGKNLAPVTRDF